MCSCGVSSRALNHVDVESQATTTTTKPVTEQSDGANVSLVRSPIGINWRLVLKSYRPASAGNRATDLITRRSDLISGITVGARYVIAVWCRVLTPGAMARVKFHTHAVVVTCSCAVTSPVFTYDNDFSHKLFKNRPFTPVSVSKMRPPLWFSYFAET